MTAVPWHLAFQIAPGAYAYLGEIEADTFEHACQTLASTQPGLQIAFVANKAFIDGKALLELADAVDVPFELAAPH